MSSPNPTIKDYVMLSPEGRVLVIPKYVFDGLCEMVDHKNHGSMEIQFKDGGFANAEIKKSLKYPNGNTIRS